MDERKDIGIVKKIVLGVGDRWALVSLLVVGSIVFFSQQAPVAFSDSKSAFVSPREKLNRLTTFVPTTIPTAIPTQTLTPIPADTPTPTVTLTPAPTVDPTSDVIWDQIAACESNGHWNDDTGNGYYGGLQFSQGAWESVGGSGNPANASREEQIRRGKMLQQRRGWSAWGACARRLGLN